MDDTNQTNPTLDQSTVPGPLPPTPPTAPVAPVEDITPNTASVAPPALEPQVKDDWTLPPVPPVAPQSETPVFPTTASAPEPAFVPPQAAPLSAPTVPQATPLPTPAPEEPVIPTEKPKNKISPIVGGLVALLFVVGVAGAAYYVSNQLSTRQAVAPTAPESEPMAGSGQVELSYTCDNGQCVGHTTVVSGAYLTLGACSQACGGGTCDKACGQTNACSKASVIGASETCAKCCCNNAIYCKVGDKMKWICGKTCPDTGVGGDVTTCDATERQLTKEKTITFENAGKIMAFSKSFTGTITLTPTSGTALVFNSADGGAAAQLPQSFNVTAGSTYTVSIKRYGTAEAYGWQPPKAVNTCGPAVVECGGDADIKTLVDLAKSKATLTGIKTATIDSSIQCWGDISTGDATQDYDYNDYAFVFGYEGTSTVVGACSDIKVYKKVNGAYGTTPLTTAQLGSLSVGDVLKFTLTSNIDNLQGRFGVKKGTGTITWLTGTIDATNKKLVTYSDYTIASAGTYQFEAQVSTAP